MILNVKLLVRGSLRLTGVGRVALVTEKNRRFYGQTSCHHFHEVESCMLRAQMEEGQAEERWRSSAKGWKLCDRVCSDFSRIFHIQTASPTLFTFSFMFSCLEQRLLRAQSFPLVVPFAYFANSVRQFHASFLQLFIINFLKVLLSLYEFRRQGRAVSSAYLSYVIFFLLRIFHLVLICIQIDIKNQSLMFK